MLQPEFLAVTAAAAFAPREIAERYLAELNALLRQVDLDAIARAVRRLRAARDEGQTIYIAGNGGSAATALGNDEGFERVFAGQLENFARSGDVLIVISASGNSRNLVRAVEVARDRAVGTIGLLGFDGGALKSMLTEVIWVPSELGAYGLVESAHAIIADIITTCLIQDVAA